MSTEDAFPYYDGPLSTYREWDVFLYGITLGIVLSIDRVREDIRREPSKLIAGTILAYAIAEARS